MFHALALVKFENGGAVHFFKALFQVTFIHGNPAAQLFDGNGLADLLQQNIPGPGYFFPVVLVVQELAGDDLRLFVFDIVKAVKQQHLRLRIHKNVLQAVAVIVVEQPFHHHAGTAAKR